MIFLDRTDAGARLGRHLAGRADILGRGVVVVALPRGGVPVGIEVARALDAPLDVVLVRKLGVPHQPELAMGAIGEDGVRVLDPEVVRRAGVGADEVERVEVRERAELARRVERFRAGRGRVDLAGRTAVVVDDGVATGSTARAGCRVVRALGATRVVLAVPVGPTDLHRRVVGDADAVVVLEAPDPFVAVGRFYRDFTQVSDDEVVEALQRRAREVGPARAEPARDPFDAA